MSVYKITNKLDGTAYVGQTTKTLEQRFKAHCLPSERGCPKMWNAIHKHGKDNFKIELLWSDPGCSQADLDAKEIAFIESEGTLHPGGYNLTKGGLGGRHSDETKKLIGEKSKKAWEENGAKWRKERAEAGRSEEAKAKTSETLLRVFKERPEIREIISKTHKGKKKSAETRERMSAAMQVRIQTEEWAKTVQERAERRMKEVYCFNSKRELVDIHPALTQTPIATGISLGRIRYSITNGTMVDGLYFSYSSELPPVSTILAASEGCLEGESVAS